MSLPTQPLCDSLHAVTLWPYCTFPLTPISDICQDTNQTLFKPCQGSEEVPCNKPVPISLSEEPCCPLHLRLPPQMYVPEQVLAVPEELEAAPTDLYLSAAELQPTESLPLEFSDVSWACCWRGGVPELLLFTSERGWGAGRSAAGATCAHTPNLAIPSHAGHPVVLQPIPRFRHLEGPLQPNPFHGSVIKVPSTQPTLWFHHLGGPFHPNRPMVM